MLLYFIVNCDLKWQFQYISYENKYQQCNIKYMEFFIGFLIYIIINNIFDKIYNLFNEVLFFGRLVLQIFGIDNGYQKNDDISYSNY